MKQELPLGLVHIRLVALDAPHGGQEQHRHEQGVVPQFLLVQGVGGHVLEAALLRAGEALHDPPGAVPAGGEVLLLLKPLAHQRHGQEGRGGVHVQRGEADGQLLVEEAGENVHVPLIPRGGVELPQPVQPHALGPFPVLVAADVVPGQVAVFHVFQEDLIVLVQDGAEGLHQAGQLAPEQLGGQIRMHVYLRQECCSS